MMKHLFYRTFFVLIATGASLAAPRPAIVQAPDDWTLTVTFEHPARIKGKLPGQKKTELFWYSILTLTNNTRNDVPFYPQCQLMTDTFQILPEGKNVTPGLYEKIKKRHQSNYPFLETLDQAGNRILQGKNNARDVLLVWPDFDHKATEIKIFVSGLSNETAVVDHPLNDRKIYLQKTLELTYNLQGDPAMRSSLKIEYKGKKWVMR